MKKATATMAAIKTTDANIKLLLYSLIFFVIGYYYPAHRAVCQDLQLAIAFY
jgi:hypothetical protein